MRRSADPDADTTISAEFDRIKPRRIAGIPVAGCNNISVRRRIALIGLFGGLVVSSWHFHHYGGVPIMRSAAQTGWYPDPSGVPGQKHWDGRQRCTENRLEQIANGLVAAFGFVVFLFVMRML
jgi:hypothetical protein